MRQHSSARSSIGKFQAFKAPSPAAALQVTPRLLFQQTKKKRKKKLRPLCDCLTCHSTSVTVVEGLSKYCSPLFLLRGHQPLTGVRHTQRPCPVVKGSAGRGPCVVEEQRDCRLCYTAGDPPFGPPQSLSRWPLSVLFV